MLKTVSIALLLLLISCESNKEFNSDIWKEKKIDWWMTDFREEMSNHLIHSDTLLQVNKKRVIELLGKPEKESYERWEYLIREKYKSDIDPVYISYLIVDFDSNDIVKSYWINKN